MRKYITVLLSTCLITFTNANAQNSTPIPNLSEVGSHCMPHDIAPISNTYFNIPQLKRPQFPDRTVNMGDKGLRADIPIHTLVNRTIEQLKQPGRWYCNHTRRKMAFGTHRAEKLCRTTHCTWRRNRIRWLCRRLSPRCLHTT